MAMESIADAMANRLDVKKYQELTDKILENPEIQIFIQDNDFEPAQVTKSLSKFNEYLKEKANEAYHEMKLNKQLAMEAEGDIKLGRSTQPSFTDLKSRIKVLKSELDDDEQNKRKRKSSNGIRYGRNAKYSPY